MILEKTILIVDDDEHLRISLFYMLQKAKYRVEPATSAEEALNCLKLHQYDLMFLDLNLPGMGGIELLVEVHRHYPRMPVLIFTAHAELDSAIQAVRLGARDYLIKPVDPVKILARVEEIFAESEHPARHKEIFSQMQNLLDELQTSNSNNSTLTRVPLPIADSGHFLKKGNFELDLEARHATLNGKYIPVTGIYFDYLCTLLRHAPKVVTYKALVKESQSYEATTVEATDLSRWRIHELRKIIEADPEHPQYILTVRGMGYRLAI